MTSPLHGWDQSWSYLDPAAAKAANLAVVAGYLSYTPSKNLTPDHIKAYHANGEGVVFNWEVQPGAPLLGADLGKTHGRDARQQALDLIKAVGYAPKNQPAIYFSCDTDVNSSQYPAIDAYYGAVKTQLAVPSVSRPYFGRRFRAGAYGEAALVAHLHEAGLTVAEWQTLAWSFGAIYRGAEFYQSGINGRLNGADIDYDEVRHPILLRAWWPPDHPLNRPIRRPIDWPRVHELEASVLSNRRQISKHRLQVARHRKDIKALESQVTDLQLQITQLKKGRPS